MIPQIGEHGESNGYGVSALKSAKRLHALQRARCTVFGQGLFADPAWEILLDLFISRHAGKRLSVSAIGFGITGSQATAIRYISLLQSEGLVQRLPDPTDGRRSFVELTVAGWEKLESFLGNHAKIFP